MDLLKDGFRGRYLGFGKHGADGLKNSFNSGGQIKYIVARIVSLFVDPFFLYIPFLSHTKMCLSINTDLWKVASIFRSLADFVVFIGCFRFAAQILLTNSRRSILTLLILFFYCLALAPIPQVLFSKKLILKTLRGYMFPILFVQYVARLALIFRSCGQFKKRVSFTTRIWVNTLVCVFLYINATHVIGASWYYISIKQQVSCWHHACKIDDGCVDSIFLCDDGTTTSTLNSTLVNEFCPKGIFLDAFQSGIVEDKGVLEKFVRCVFWGLRTLSSFASGIQTSADVDDETAFLRIIISAVAVILLTYIIEYIMRYAELATARSERTVDKMKLIIPLLKLLVKYHNLNESTEKLIMEHIHNALENDINSFNLGRLHINSFHTNTESLFEDLRILETSMLSLRNLNIRKKAEKWLLDNNISPYQNNILFYLICGLKDDQDVNLEGVLSVLPDECQWIVKKDLCFDTLIQVRGLQKIDEELFRRMSSIIKPKIFAMSDYIIREGEPLDFIMFITGGIAWIYKSSSVSRSLQKGDFYGEELIQWILDRRRKLGLDGIPPSSVPLSGIPFSTLNVKCRTQVEALVLRIEDLASFSDFPDDSSRAVYSVTEEDGSSVRTEIVGV